MEQKITAQFIRLLLDTLDSLQKGRIDRNTAEEIAENLYLFANGMLENAPTCADNMLTAIYDTYLEYFADYR